MFQDWATRHGLSFLSGTQATVTSHHPSNSISHTQALALENGGQNKNGQSLVGCHTVPYAQHLVFRNKKADQVTDTS